MKVLVYLFHPNLEKSRVNRRWLEELRKHPEITVCLPYETSKSWQFDVAHEQKKLETHDRIVFQFPFYWYSSPPLMKKWLDDVLTYGWAYGPQGDALKGKEFVIAVSTGGPSDAYIAGGYNNYSLSELLKPLQQTANLIQMKFLPFFSVNNAIRATPEELEASALAYVRHIMNPELNPQIKLERLLSEMKKSGVQLKA